MCRRPGRVVRDAKGVRRVTESQERGKPQNKHNMFVDEKCPYLGMLDLRVIVLCGKALRSTQSASL